MIDPYIAFCMIMTVSGIQLDPINVVLDRHGKLVADFPGKMILADGDSIDRVEFMIEGCPAKADHEPTEPVRLDDSVFPVKETEPKS